MQEQRRLPRKRATNSITVRDLNTDRPLGRIVNLTSEGIMLIGPVPVESNLVFQLELNLPMPHLGRSSLQLGAESLWCSDASEPDNYWAGFRIIDISLGTVELIESLVDSWETDGSYH